MSAPTVADHASCRSIRLLYACINTHNGCHRMNAAVAPEPRAARIPRTAILRFPGTWALPQSPPYCGNIVAHRPGAMRNHLVPPVPRRGLTAPILEGGGIPVRSNRAAARGRSTEKRGIIGGLRGGPAGSNPDSTSASR